MIQKFKWEDGTELEFEDFYQGVIIHISIGKLAYQALCLVIKKEDHDFLMRRPQEEKAKKIIIGYVYHEEYITKWPSGTYVPIIFDINKNHLIAYTETLDIKQKLLKQQCPVKNTNLNGKMEQS